MSGRTNRGPAAAGENRAAIVAAARELFAAEGYTVSLARIAQRAGVGRASLYRHFPDRLDLAWAIFEENLNRLEALSARPGADTFFAMVDEVVAMVVDNAALVEMVVVATRTHAPPPMPALEEIFRRPLQAAHAAGRVANLRADDLPLLLRMIWGAIVTEPERSARQVAATRCLQLVDPQLAPWACETGRRPQR